MSIYSAERIIQEINVGIAVNSSSETDTLFLATAEIDAFLSDLRLVPSRQHFQIWLQSTCFDDLLIATLVQWLAEKNILLQSQVLNPGLLTDVGDTSLKTKEQSRNRK